MPSSSLLQLPYILIIASCFISSYAQPKWPDWLRTKEQVCPPEGFDSVLDFDTKAYASAPWYATKQVPITYQKKDDLFCVQAQYKQINATDTSAGYKVYNSAKKGGVNGSTIGSSPTSDFQMVALPDTASGRESKLLVGPELLTKADFLKFAYGPYWVVAVGPSNDATVKYDWAVISGGSPSWKSGSACSTFWPIIPTTRQYKGGLWLFVRNPQNSTATAAAESAAKGLGLDIDQLADVEHKKCVYPEPY